MTARVQLPPVGRLDLFQHPERLDITVWDGSELVGHVFPVVILRPDGEWCARRTGQDGRYFPTKEAALEHITGQHTNLEEIL